MPVQPMPSASTECHACADTATAGHVMNAMGVSASVAAIMLPAALVIGSTSIRYFLAKFAATPYSAEATSAAAAASKPCTGTLAAAASCVGAIWFHTSIST